MDKSSFNSKELIILGGPSCAGKTFLIKKIQLGQYPSLCSQLGILNPSSWRYIAARKLKSIDLTYEDQLVVHYDFYTQQSKEDEFNNLTTLIANFDKISVVTIRAPRSTLIKRNSLRIIMLSLKYIFLLLRLSSKKRRVIVLQKLHNTRAKNSAYKNGVSELLYEKWFKYFSQLPEVKHYVLNTVGSNIVELRVNESHETVY